MSGHRRKGRPRKFESLEQRNLLAGDVTASIQNGDLVIKGDDFANGITITAGATAGSVVITGVNAGGSATNVNGTANGSVTLTGFTDDLKIKMKDGDDTVSITDLTIPDDLKFEGGSGNDTLTISEVTINDSLKINLGKGDDTLTVDDTTVTDDAKIKTKRGEDNATITDSTFNDLTVKMGKDDDNLSISGTTVHDDTKLNGKKGTNILTQGAGNSLGDLSIKNFQTNSAPTVDLNTVTAITENNSATLTGSFTDADLADTHTLTADWGDPNNSVDSTFAIPATSGLAVNQTITSSTDSAVLTITAINSTTGQVTFSMQHKYADDGVSPSNNTASDTNTITVTVKDGGVLPASDSTTVTVNNAVPTVALNAVTAINETNTATLTGSFTDIGISDVHTMTVNWGDPNNATNSTFTVPATSGLSVNQTINASSADAAVLTITAVNKTTGQVTFSVQHKYSDDGASPGNSSTSDNNTITVTVADDDTGSGNSTTTVTVNNVAPTVALNAVSAITENNTATLTGSYTDVGVSDAHTVTVNWGDANNSTNSTFTVPATSALTVNQAINSSSTDGAVLTITAINTTTGQVTFSVQHKYLDDGVSPGNTTTSDTSTITVTVADDDNQNGSNTTTVTVNNVAPTVALNAVSAINENGTATLTGSYTDIGASDVHTVTVNWGDPNSSTNSTFTVPATRSLVVNQTVNSSSADGAVLTITAINAATGQVSFSVQHKYADDGLATGNNTASDSSTITVTIADDDTGSTNTTTTVLVNNLAPTVALNTVPAINENRTATLTGSFTDVGLSDVHTMTVNWGDPRSATNSTFTVPATSGLVANQTVNSTSGDGAVLTISAINAATGQVTFSVQHKYIDDGSDPNNTASDTSTITVTVADDDTGSANNTTTVTINNVAPTVDLNSVSDIDENGTATLTGSYTDIGLSDAHTVTVNWGDPNNSTNSTFAVGPTSGLVQNQTINSSSADGAVLTIAAINAATGQVSFSVQHKYLDDGATPGNNLSSDTNTITVTVADDDTGSGSDTSSVTVNNVAPTVALNSVTGISENGTATLTGTFTDIGLLDEHTLTVNWGDANNGVNSTFSLDDFLDPLQVNQTFNSADGAVLTITALDASTGQVTFSVQHKYLDDGPVPNNTASDISTIGVTVTDDDAQSGSDTRFVTVSNVTPMVALNSVTGVTENGTATLTGSYTDIGLLDAHTLSVNWGDPNNSTDSTFAVGPTSGLVENQTFDSTSADGAVLTIATLNAATGQVSFSVQHKYLDDGPAPNNTESDISTIAVTVTDDDGQSGSDSRFVTISNAAPSVALNSVPSISENGNATLSGSYTDIGLLDAHALTVNWGDPNNSTNSTFAVGPTNGLVATQTFNSTSGDGAVLTITAVDTATGQVSFSVHHQYLDDGLAPGNSTDSDINTIAVTVTDDDGESGSSSRFITIGNVAAEISDPGDDAIDENSEVTIVAKITDPGTQDVFSVEVDWKDGTPDVISGLGLSDIAETVTGTTTYSWDADTRQLTLNRRRRPFHSIPFHSMIPFHSIPFHSIPFDIYAVTLRPSDDDGGTGAVQTVNITVNNVVPSVALNAVAGTFSIPATLTGTFTDIGLQDEHTLTVDWDDPNNENDSVFVDMGAVQTLSVDDTFTSSGADTTTTLRITSVNATTGVVGFEVKHTYTSTGTRTIEVVAEDDDLGQSVAATATAVIVPGID